MQKTVKNLPKIPVFIYVVISNFAAQALYALIRDTFQKREIWNHLAIRHHFDNEKS